MGRGILVVAAALVCAWGSASSGEVHIETVLVGNPGNPDDIHGDGYGGVGYTYAIGKYEVTAGQYCEFLNAVAATDTYWLYSSSMWSKDYGCKIQQSGSPGSYTYSVAGDWADRPMNGLCWGDAARFANWLHNGQPTGPQGLATTEDGAYFLNGATGYDALMAVRREDDWRWALPSEDEWYKAAYHKNDGVTGNYFDYPTRSDTVPGYVNDSGNLSTTGSPFVEGGTDPGNYATYDGDDGARGIGSPYYRTVVGEWENSESPYGTFDQGGNVWEWNEAAIMTGEPCRGHRGGAYGYGGWNLQAEVRGGAAPTYPGGNIGFRVVKAPEPTQRGDCDEDGDVDFDDFSVLAFNFGSTGDWTDGDFDGDGIVDFDDFGALALNFGTTAAPAPTGRTVPEPATAALLALGGLVLVRGRRR
jgi:formylglycine-generating enzyme required for sulfatase activity